jgi:uncharacterized membrane protein
VVSPEQKRHRSNNQAKELAMSRVQTGEFGGSIGGSQYEAHFSHAGKSRQRDELNRVSEGYQAAEGACCGQNVGGIERALSAAAGLGLAIAGIRRGRLPGLVLTGLGAGLLWRGMTGRCQMYAALGLNTAEHNPATAVPSRQGFKIEKTITVNRPPSELFRFWRRLENLPQVMRHLKNVETIDNEHSHWKAEGVFGADVEWDAEIINERENELIAWRSLPGGDVDTAGSIHFKPLRDNGATEVALSMKYNPPAGKVGAQVASLFGMGLEAKLNDDLRRFKQVMETGMAAAPATAGGWQIT